MSNLDLSCAPRPEAGVLSPSSASNSEFPRVTLAEYVQHLRAAGQKVVVGADSSFWRRGEAGSLVRLPTIGRTTASETVLRKVLLAGRAAVASYLVEPTATKPANANLYLCEDRQYSLDSLKGNARNHIRRALRSLDIAWMSGSDLIAHGFPAYRDSRERNGLADGTEAAFEQRYAAWVQNPAHHVLGACRTGVLVAFFSVVAVDDWVELGGHSLKEGMQWNPNNGLMHFLLNYYLTEGRAQVVSYGLSTIQENTKAEGLHVFKLGVGFTANPVHRVFYMHPIFRPLVNPGSLALANRLLRISPGSRWLRKACGALKAIVENTVES